ncbi:hypothetical protein [Streptomyces tritici]|uniref:hypothetical protein n=1 Tax=Streptomyces tritici TaxID=2054410 RepID=UPI003AEFC86D
MAWFSAWIRRERAWRSRALMLEPVLRTTAAAMTRCPVRAARSAEGAATARSAREPVNSASTWPPVSREKG